LKAWRAARDNNAVAAALKELKRSATAGTNIMPASIACAKAGVTTGEWGWTLRETFGEYRAPTGVGLAMRNDVTGLDDIRADVDRISRKLGRRLTFWSESPVSMAIQWRRADRRARAPMPVCRSSTRAFD
jgi:(2R)-ethylmalonyl-CoA mutase